MINKYLDRQLERGASDSEHNANVIENDGSETREIRNIFQKDDWRSVRLHRSRLPWTALSRTSYSAKNLWISIRRMGEVS